MIGTARDREHERVVTRGVARVQRGHDLGTLGQLGVGDEAAHGAEPILSVARGARGRPSDELGARLDGPQRAAARGPEHELVQHGAERALARAAVDERRRRVARARRRARVSASRRGGEPA